MKNSNEFNFQRLIPAFWLFLASIFLFGNNNLVASITSIIALCIVCFWIDSRGRERLSFSLFENYGDDGLLVAGLFFISMFVAYIATKALLNSYLTQELDWESGYALLFLLIIVLPITLVVYVIRRVFQLRGNRMFLECGFYFGYGAFSSHEELKRLIPTSYNLGKHVLKGYRSGYCVISKNRKCVTYGIEKKINHSCKGRLYFIDDFSRLDEIEDRGRYLRKIVWLYTFLPVYIYFPLKIDWETNLKPSQKYDAIIKKEIIELPS